MSEEKSTNIDVEKNKDDIAVEKDEEKKDESPFLKKNTAEKVVDDADGEYQKAQQKYLEQMTDKNAVFRRKCKLYFMAPDTGRLETRGAGTMTLMKCKTDLHRLTMWRDGIMTKGCDHYIAPSAKLVKAKEVENAFAWVAIKDQSDAEVNYDRTTYFAVFNNKKEAAEFEKFFEQARENNLEVFKDVKKNLDKKKEDDEALGAFDSEKPKKDEK